MRQKPAWMGSRPFIVVDKVRESTSVSSFYLKPKDGGTLPSFRPGQYIELTLNVPGHPRPIMRTYTLSNSAINADHYRLSIKREPSPATDATIPAGISSNFMHDHIHKDSILELRAPAGDFVLRPSGKGPVVLLGGGIGCTPLISMISSVFDSGGTRDLWFIHGVRNKREHAFGKYVRSLAKASDNIHVHVRYSHPDNDGGKESGHDSEGHVDIDLLRKLLPGPSPIFYLCGPTSFMHSLYQGLINWGVDPFQINYEFFGDACNLRNPNLCIDEVIKTDSEKYKVTFQRSGISVPWSPECGSLLALAEKTGVGADFVCRSGVCQTCETKVIGGTFTYINDSVIPPENDCTVLICSSRPTSDLVLDL